LNCLQITRFVVLDILVWLQMRVALQQQLSLPTCGLQPAPVPVLCCCVLVTALTHSWFSVLS
jgi:hypothetical protein